MTREEAIALIKAKADTPYGVLGPSKVVALTMHLISELRTERKQSWNAIAALFNQAMVSVGGDQLAPAHLCRLFNLELKREALRSRRGDGASRTEVMPQDAAGTAATEQVRGVAGPDRVLSGGAEQARSPDQVPQPDRDGPAAAPPRDSTGVPSSRAVEALRMEALAEAFQNLARKRK